MVCSVAALMRFQSIHVGGVLHQLGSIALAPSWCNAPLSGVTPLRYKRDCGLMPTTRW